MAASTRRHAAAAPVSTRLARLVADGVLAADPLQTEAARLLDTIATTLGAADGQRPLLAKLLQRQAAARPRGAYLYGAVGRGKTLLMDLFYEAVAEPRKRRVHYHEFMDEIHAAMARYRATPHGRTERADPIAAVVKPILAKTRLLCLDEFRVDDITNAMLLGRLFEKLFAGGLVLVATSNVKPGDLYENGLNRALFLPFIALLETAVTVFTLDGPTDYRRQKFDGQQIYYFGTGAPARAAMDRLWTRLTGGGAGRPETISVLGRRIEVPEAAMGVARFPAGALIDKPLGARDYLRLAHAYDTLLLDDVPQFDRSHPSAAKRFILLIDTLYDAGVKLGASFAVPIDRLGADPRTALEFERAASRLIEMQSADYLGAPRKTIGHELPATLA